MDKDLKKIIDLSKDALKIVRSRTNREIGKLRRKGLNQKDIKMVSEKVAKASVKEGQRLNKIFKKELSVALDRLNKAAQKESKVASKKAKKK
ncbi:hypothetical protein ACFLZX_06690 [Nanoarchaeota archaeon]